MSNLHIVFPQPGNWNHFRMVCQWQDAEGYTSTETHRSVPVEHMPTMQAVVASIAGLGEPWQATLVCAALVSPESGEAEGIELSVHARREDGARKVFTSEDYPALRLTDEASVAFFRHFTHQH